MSNKMFIIVDDCDPTIYKNCDIEIEYLNIDNLCNGVLKFSDVEHLITDPEWKEIVPDYIQEIIEDLRRGKIK